MARGRQVDNEVQRWIQGIAQGDAQGTAPLMRRCLDPNFLSLLLWSREEFEWGDGAGADDADGVRGRDVPARRGGSGEEGAESAARNSRRVRTAMRLSE